MHFFFGLKQVKNGSSNKVLVSDFSICGGFISHCFDETVAWLWCRVLTRRILATQRHLLSIPQESVPIIFLPPQRLMIIPERAINLQQQQQQKKKTRRKKSAERRPLRIPHSAFRNGFLSHRLVSYFDYVLVPLLKLTNYHTRQFLSPPLPFSPPPPACHAPDTLNII